MNSLSVLKRTIHTAAVTLVVLLIGQGETQAVQGLLRQSTPPADIGIGYVPSGIGAPIACALTVGNPVNITNGNKYQREEDLVGLPGALPVSFVRYYNSRAEARGPLGVGWRHNYHYQLGIAGDRIIVLQGDGRLLYFDPTEDVIDGKRLYRGRLAKDGKLLANSIGYEWRLHDGKVLRFTKDGHLFDIRWQGSRILLHRDRDGRLLQVSDSQDRRIRFGYDKRGRIISIMDPGERHTRYVYDDNNNLHKIIRPDEAARTYHYEDKRDVHNLTGITDERGVRFATWAYDDEDRAILSTHSDGVGEIRIQYGEGHRLVTDALGQVLTYTIEKVAGTPVISRVEGSGGEGCAADGVQYRYNDHLQLVSKTESNGLTRHYTYDESGRLIQIAESAAAQTDAAGAVRLIAKYAYRDDESWPSLITEPSVAPDKTHQWWLSHNDQGRISEVLEVGYTPDFEGDYLEMVRTTRFTYKNGNLVTTDGPQAGDKDLVRYHYDSNGRFTHSDSGLTSGDRIETFDAYGHPSRLLDGRGQSTSLEYDDRGRLINLATQAQGSSSLNVSLEYDAVGHITAVEGPNGRVSAEYDPAGRPISVTFPDGSRRQWHWDAKGRLLTRESHDKQGQRLVEQKNQYDLSGRLIASTNEEEEGYQYRYDPVGRLQKLINPLGQATGYRYDAWGRMTDIIRGEGEDQAVTESRSYDTHGVLISHTDGRGNTSTQRYDDFGHRLWRNTPDGGMVMYRYDDAGRVKVRVDESGIIHRFDYDEHGRLIGIGGFDQPATTHFHYTGDGKPQTLDGLRQQTRYTYDPTGRITEQAITLKDPDQTYKLTYQHDERGRMIKKRLPGGETLLYQYQGEETIPSQILLDGWLQDTPIIGGLERDAQGRLLGISHGNGQQSRYSYDRKGRLQHLEIPAGDTDYRHDPLHRLIEQRQDETVQHYRYDSLGRLSQAEGPEGIRHYTYDTAGNRTHIQQPNLTADYRYAKESNRLLQVGKQTFTYDATGRPLTRGALRYEYNAGGRPVAVHHNDRLIAEYAYNSEGERIQKTDHTQTPAKTTHYLYENKQLIAELDAKGEVIKQYLYLSGRPFAMLQDGTLYAIHTDWRHAPVSITGPDGNIVWQADYSPFGQAEVESDPDGNGEHLQFNLRLPGQYHDAETSTAYNLYRDYDPQSGRYLTSDPLGATAGLNTYAYVDNDPLNRIDPLGLYGKEIHYYMTYFLAMAAGVPQETALRIANAAQGIDDNPLTTPNPFISGNWSRLKEALQSYHFTADYNDTNHGDGSADPATRFENPTSDQLSRLYKSAMLTDRACISSSASAADIKSQLYGEYLHALADTYSHRQANNVPYDPSKITGHLFAAPTMFYPDHTYNSYGTHMEYDILEDDYVTRTDAWRYNEARTLEMERHMFERIREDYAAEIAANPKAKNITWEDLAGNGDFNIGVKGDPLYQAATWPGGNAPPMQKFNMEQNEAKKIEGLNKHLKALGFDEIPTPNKGNMIEQREQALEGFADGDSTFPGVMLPNEPY